MEFIEHRKNYLHGIVKVAHWETLQALLENSQKVYLVTTYQKDIGKDYMAFTAIVKTEEDAFEILASIEATFSKVFYNINITQAEAWGYQEEEENK